MWGRNCSNNTQASETSMQVWEKNLDFLTLLCPQCSSILWALCDTFALPLSVPKGHSQARSHSYGRQVWKGGLQQFWSGEPGRRRGCGRTRAGCGRRGGLGARHPAVPSAGDSGNASAIPSELCSGCLPSRASAALLSAERGGAVQGNAGLCGEMRVRAGEMPAPPPCADPAHTAADTLWAGLTTAAASTVQYRTKMLFLKIQLSKKIEI